MRVLQVTPLFYPFLGGTPLSVYYLSRELVRLGHEVTVLTSLSRSQRRLEDLDGMRVVRSQAIFQVYMNPILPLVPIEVLRQPRPDIVNAHTPWPPTADLASLGSLAAHIPFAVTYRADLRHTAYESTFKASLCSLYLNLFSRLLHSASRKIIVLSRFGEKVLEAYGVEPRKIEVIPNGVDIQSFKPMEREGVYSARLGIPLDRFNILYVGRIEVYKGLASLVRAFAQFNMVVRDSMLLVLGEGGFKDTLRGLSKRLGIEGSVKFLGSVPNREMPKVYACVDAVVQPSPSEFFSRVVLEAMACGKPVIATKTGANPDVITPSKDGLLVDTESPTQIAEALSLLHSDTRKASAIGEAARETVARSYTWTQIAERTVGCYRSLLEAA